MRNITILFAALLISVASAAALGATKIVSVELAIEASTDMTTLPATNTGPVVLSCASCKTRSYPVTPQTAYFLGAKTVTLAQLNAFVSANGTRFLTIFVTPDGSAVTRIAVATP